MKKLVFSSICVAALSTSTFAASELDLTIKTNTPWYKQLGNQFNESLLDKDWTAGKTAIGSILGKSDATVDNKTIVGAFLTATANNTKDANNEKENGYYLGKYGADNKGGLQVVVTGLNATAKDTKIDTAKAIKDYVLVDAQLDKASAAAKIYNALGAKNVVKTDIDGENSTKKMASDFVLADGDDREALVEALLEANKNKTDGSEKLSHYQKNDDKGGKTLDDTKIADGIKALFTTGTGALKDYDGTILKEASSDKTKLESMKTKIIADINSLVASSKNQAEALHIQAQLNDALAMLDKYKEADKQITKLEDKVTKAGDVVKGKFTSATGYTNVIKKDNVAGGDVLTSAKDIKNNITKVAGDNMNTEAKKGGAAITIDDKYALDGTGLSIDQAIAWVKAKGDTSVVGTSGYTKNSELLDALNEIKSAITEGREIDTKKADYAKIKVAFKKTADGDSIALTEAMITQYNGAIDALGKVTDKELQAIITANAELDSLKSSLASSSITGTLKTNEINKALGELSSVAPAQAKELAKLFVKDDGTAITAGDIEADAATEFTNLSAEDKAKLGAKEEEQKANYVKQKVAEHNAKIQTAANKIAQTVADSKKDAVMTEALSTLNIQLNNMNKRMGELRGLDGDAGVWLRTWGGKMSNDTSDFTYYSTQLGADKKSSLKGGDLYLGLLTGFDKANSDVKSTSYSFGAYGSYIANNGFFADGVMKFITTSHDRSGYDIANQKSFLASFEGGYRFDLSDAFYVEPSVEFVTGRIGEYNSKKDNVTISVDAFSPVVFKPQAFVGGAVDAFTYRAGVGAVLTAKEQTANVEIKDIIADLNGTKLNANGSTKLGKNNHGFVSLGTSYKATENLRINLGLERSFGGDITNDYEVNATVRYGF